MSGVSEKGGGVGVRSGGRGGSIKMRRDGAREERKYNFSGGQFILN
jgi:hypothetical protein